MYGSLRFKAGFREEVDDCGDYQSIGDGVWTLDEAFHELQMQLQ
jgi:hypothetical protein